MDILNDILHTLDLKGALYFRTDFSGQWAVTVPTLGQAARFHLVVQGRCHVDVTNGAASDLETGDLILIPRGQSHVLADRAGRDAPDLEDVLKAAGYSGDGVLVAGEGDDSASTQLICGHFTFRHGADHPLLRALPDSLVTSATVRAEEPWLDDMLRFITRKMFSGQVGSHASVIRLSEIVFIELLRVGLDNAPGLKGLADAFQDPQVGKALTRIHADPSHAWTVDSLASDVGMSRSRFAERFRDLVGHGPMSYLADWRLQKALALLDQSRGSVQEIAGQIGYQSPAAFTRAFTAKFGSSPSDYRRIHQ